MDDEEEEKMEEARQWSSFVMDDALQSKEMIKEKLKQLQEDLDEKVDVKKENVRNFNFISYLHWRLGDREKAFDALKHAEELENEPNLITHCNKILFFKGLEKHYRSKELLEILKNSKDFKSIRTQSQATAEIGYCFSRLGPQHHDRAVRLFKKAIAGMAPERNILWEYGLALTLRRQSHIFQMTKPEQFRPDEKKKEAANLLYEIIELQTDNCCHIKARAWCEMNRILFRSNLFEVINKNKKETVKIDQKRCFEEAIKLCPKEYFVLEKYGVYLRYTRNLEKSKEVLESAMQFRETAFSRHHLALTLKKMVEVATPRPACSRNLQHFYSMPERQDSTYDSGIFSMTEGFESLSVVPKHTDCTGKSIPHDGAQLQMKQASYKPKIQRSKSSGWMKQHKIRSGKYDTTCTTPHHYQTNSTSIRYFSIPKLDNSSKSPLKSQCKTDTVDRNQIHQESTCFQERKIVPFYRNQSPANIEKQSFISARKSPRSVCVSPGNPLLAQAVKHLQRAIEICEGFDVARYELGLIYRMLEKPDEALDYFSFITSNNCGKPSEYPMTLINAYEQQSICKLHLSYRETDPKKKEELEFDAKKCMWKALSIISAVIGTIPLLKTTNQCFPTLKKLLQKGEKSSKTIKELAKLHELMDYNEEAIKFYRQIVDVERNDSATIKNLAQNYMKVGDFENAIRTSSLLQYAKDPYISDKSFFVDTCIKGALDSLRKPDLEEAKIRFLTAYSQIFSHLNVSVTKEEDDESPPDILVLHKCGDDGCCYQKYVRSVLESFVKLKCVVNDEDCLPGCRQMVYLNKTMLESRCICMILHESNDDVNTDEFLDRTLEIASVKHRAKILQIRTEGVPPEDPGCKEVVLPCDCRDTVHNDSSQLLLRGELFSEMLVQMSHMFREKTI